MTSSANDTSIPRRIVETFRTNLGDGRAADMSSCTSPLAHVDPGIVHRTAFSPTEMLDAQRVGPDSVSMRCALLLWVALTAGCSLPRGVIAPSNGVDAHGGADGGGIDGGVADGGIDAAMAIDAMAIDASQDAAGMSDATDVGMGHDAPSCTEGAMRCHTGNTAIEVCTGGVWATGSMCFLGCMTTPSVHCATYTPANVTSLTNSGPDVMLTASTTLITDGCVGLGSATGHVVAQSGGAPMVCLIEVNTLSVAAGVTVNVVGAYPLVIVSQGAVHIDGVIDVSSYVNPTAPMITQIGAGAGTGGNAGTNGTAGNGNTDGGGGGGGLGGNGGNGADEGMMSAAGNGGMGVTSTLTPLIGGAHGGNGSGNTVAAGGAGGGAIQISSYTTIAITGTIAAAGAAGHGGDSGGGGCGGGSGGGILLEAASVTLAAHTPPPTLTVAGGGGGAGSCFPAAGPAGTDGFYAGVSTAAGGVVTTGCMQHDGGAGGGGGAANGTASMSNGGTNGSGGGGSAGIIVIRTLANTIPAGTTDPSGGGALIHAMLMVH
jgi:hypothetical protein